MDSLALTSDGYMALSTSLVVVVVRRRFLKLDTSK